MVEPIRQHSRAARASARRGRVPGTASVYGVQGLLDDQRRLLERSGDTGEAGARQIVEDLDGRMVVIHGERLRPVLARTSVPASFAEKYGGTAEGYWRRFRLVMELLLRCRSQIAAAGLATESGRFAVREAFVKRLLRHPLPRTGGEIPQAIVGRFLDEWGHRWM